MRAYVITGTRYNVLDAVQETVGVVSSKKAAIEACEEYLNHDVSWETQEKHNGYAVSNNGPVEVTYQMFFINQVDKLKN